MKATARRHAFTMAELLIAMMGSTLILGALLLSSMQLQRALHASERYATSQSDQRRLIDYLSRDLRRAIGIASTTTLGGSAATRLAGAAVTVEEGLTLVLTLPGFYQSDVPEAEDYDAALPVVAARDHVDYGGPAGPAPGVRVMYRRQVMQTEGSECFVRFEGETETVIVRGAENLHLTVATSEDGRSCTMEVTFIPPGNGRMARVSSHDQILLRNIRTD